MNSLSDVLPALRDYYGRQGIGAEQFRCSHASACSAGYAGFTTAKEAYVGARFGMDGLPRLVFLSLDSGDSDVRGALTRTLEYLRNHEETFEATKLNHGRHWFQTRKLALALLQAIRPELTINNVHRYFAHTNSAKCCLNLPGRRMASARLFDNCRPYIPGELEILSPAILVTQGRWAHVAVEKGFAGRITKPLGAPYQLVSIRERLPTLWLTSYHPRYAHGYWPQQKRDWSSWADAVRQVLGDGSRTSVG